MNINCFEFSHNAKCSYDLNGNVIQIDYNHGAFSTYYQYEYGERLIKIGNNNNIVYDNDGRLISKMNYNFTYNANGTLKSITYREKDENANLYH